MKTNFEQIAKLSDKKKRIILEEFGADFSDMNEPINYDSHFEDDWITPEELFSKYPELVSEQIIEIPQNSCTIHLITGIELVQEN